jgi:hypothetical protein
MAEEPDWLEVIVRHEPPAWCCPGASPQVESSLSSGWWHPGPATSQRPDCQRDRQPASRPATANVRSTTGLHIGPAPSSGRRGAAGAVDGGQQQLSGDRLDPVASVLRVALDRIVHLSRQPLVACGKRGEHPADLGTTDAELGLGWACACRSS